MNVKKYTHWLKYTIWCDNKEIEDINNYIEKYPSTKAVVHPYKYNCDKAIKLVCEQSYQDLDLDVNSMGTNLIRLTRKPNNLQVKSIDFKTWYSWRYNQKQKGK